MNLLKCEKHRIIDAILADVPFVDYEGRIRVKALELAAELLPLPARALWDDLELRPLVVTHHHYVRTSRWIGLSLPGYGSDTERVPGNPEIQQLAALLEEQEARQDALRRDLEAAFASIRTVKAFEERFPEFVGYLPARTPSEVANLPATTAVLDGLKAAGWQEPSPELTTSAA